MENFGSLANWVLFALAVVLLIFDLDTYRKMQKLRRERDEALLLVQQLTSELDARGGPQTAKSKQYATEEVPSAVVTEDDGFICDMALEYGATLLNDEGTVYSFTEAQLLTFTKANRKPRVRLSDKALWRWYQKNLGTELPHTEAVAVGILKGIIRKVYGDDAQPYERSIKPLADLSEYEYGTKLYATDFKNGNQT